MADPQRAVGAPFPLSARHLVIGWLLVAALFAGQNVTGALTQGRPIEWQWAVVHELIYWGLWACSAPIVAGQARRHWIEPGSGPAPWLAHLALAVFLVPAQVAATYLVHGTGLLALGLLPAADYPAWLAARSRSVLILSFPGFVYYWMIVGGYYAAAYRRLYLVQRAEAAEAELGALRAQLEPHFLFNTLNSVAVLATEQPGVAARVLTKLSSLLRTVLRHDPRQEIPLGEELEFIDGYLEIQRVRFESRLKVELTIAGEVRAAFVPAMLLQPLIENAIRHAVEPRVDGGRIAVRAARDGDQLRIEIEDDGPGMAAAPESNGIGIANTRSRLNRLFGSRHSLEFERSPSGGTLARIRLPFRTAA